MYVVTVFEGRRKIDSVTFPIGQFMEIGYWMDNAGYIAEGYRVVITITEEGQ